MWQMFKWDIAVKCDFQFITLAWFVLLRLSCTNIADHWTCLAKCLEKLLRWVECCDEVVSLWGSHSGSGVALTVQTPFHNEIAFLLQVDITVGARETPGVMVFVPSFNHCPPAVSNTEKRWHQCSEEVFSKQLFSQLWCYVHARLGNVRSDGHFKWKVYVNACKSKFRVFLYKTPLFMCRHSGF